jgi:glycerate 2-kinase
MAMRRRIDRRRLRDAEAREPLLEVLEVGLRSVDPGSLIERTLERRDDTLRIGEHAISVRGRRCWLIAVGKASVGMAAVAERVLGPLLAGGVAIAPHGAHLDSQRVLLQTAGHPVPDEGSVAAAEAVERLARGLGERDVVLCLLSGGGTALLASPAEGLGLDDLQKAFRVLLASGSPIGEMNAVRRHLTTLQGGRLAQKLYPAETYTLVLSDVVGNALEVVASGPTVPDPSRFADARRVVERRGLTTLLPDSVRRRIAEGEAGRLPETPKPGDEVFRRSSAGVLADGSTFVGAAEREARRAGWRIEPPPVRLVGEAREAGRLLGRGLRSLRARPGSPVGWILSGETTVAVSGRGRGGRNQELALAAAEELLGVEGVLLASLATDGVDGPTDAAGAIVDGRTVEIGRAAGWEADRVLAENDVYPCLHATGDLLFTGPTGTNVADVVVGYVDGV